MPDQALQTPQHRYAWKVLGIVMIGTFMAALDQSIVNVSLPAIMADFHVRLTEIEWVITGYMLAFATLMPVTTWLRDRMGHKLLFILSLSTFTLGSLLCGLAWNNNSLIAARVLQAFGGGAMTPTAMAMLSEVFPQERRGRALGYWGMGVIIGPSIGPTLGGFLTKNVGWRSIFLVNLPIGLIGIALAVSILRADRPQHKQHRPFDLWGFVSLTVFLLAFLLALSRADHFGWISPYILTCFALAIAGFVAFLFVERKTKTGSHHGIIDLRLFKSRVFSACILVSLIRAFALYGGIFLLPLFLQQVMGMDEMQSGLLLLPGSLFLSALMPFTGKLSDKVGPRYLATLGLLAVTAFMFMYRDLSLTTSLFWLIFPTFIRGIGISLLFTPVMVAAINSAPKHKAAMASAMINLAQQIGGSIGIALLATVLSHRLKFFLGTGLQWKAAAAKGFDQAFLVGGFVVAIGLFAALLLPKQLVREETSEEALGTME